jgi:formylglycine-generating enzyme required for sulfatase activity
MLKKNFYGGIIQEKSNDKADLVQFGHVGNGFWATGKHMKGMETEMKIKTCMSAIVPALLALILLAGCSGGSGSSGRIVISPTPTPSPTPAPTTNPLVKMVMVRIPAGDFWMGSPTGEGGGDEYPRHQVYLDDYDIGKYEVTNDQFYTFVSATGYQAEGNWQIYYNAGTANYPVVNVTWNDAVAYCNWAGLHLPTEAQWEKAARGTDERDYPWGNTWVDGACNYNSGRPKPFGSHPMDSSPCGIMDMAGNVSEWCADWYGERYYFSSPRQNPEGPAGGSSRVYRSGSYYDTDSSATRTACRKAGGVGIYLNYVGFRCVRTP